MLRCIPALLLALLAGQSGLALAATPPGQAPEVAERPTGDSPADVVGRLQATLLEVMQEAGRLGYRGRFDRLAPAIRDSHDLAGIARLTVGRFWNDWDRNQQQTFLDTFAELSIASYASQLNGYAGETFQILSTEQPEQDTALVRTRLVQPGAESRRLDYSLRRTEAGWRIVNITYDGISDLALKRSEYTSILRREGFAALLARLKDKIAGYAGGSG